MKNNLIYPTDDVEMCAGCGLCAASCAAQAITMREDKAGFLIPVVDSNRCVRCGACQKVCQARIKLPLFDQPEAYAAVNRNEAVLKQSSSGGVFSALSDMVLSRGGSVFGCVFDEKFNLFHTEVQDESGIEKMRGSKYMQSNAEDSYALVKKRLNDGKMVLYTGTPCQIAALRVFLKKEYDNLITMDLVCHGVASNRMFQDYLNYLEKQIGGEIKEFYFRHKGKEGSFRGAEGYLLWEKCGVHKRKSVFFQTSSYYYYYMACASFRSSCYSCPYAQKGRIADFTIGDLWGAEKMQLSVPRSKGISLLLANSDRAKKWMTVLNEGLWLCPADYEMAVKNNSQLKSPSHCPELRQLLLSTYRDQGYEGVERMFKPQISKGRFAVAKIKLVSCVPPSFRKKAKSFVTLIRH